MSRFARSPKPEFAPSYGPPRVLFLDDDPERAEVFLNENPVAVWVKTAAECIARLEERWDEVHLDHDLGGEQFVDVARDDCGMAVVRWIGFEPRPHLRRAEFFVHSHNGVAAMVMLLQLKGLGLRASARPFGEGAWKPAPPPPPSFWRRLLARINAGRRRGATSSPTDDMPPA
jgi:NAD+-processing family protein with receiver domain